MADEIYLEPLSLDTVKRVIIKERPDSLLAGLGRADRPHPGHAADQGRLAPAPTASASWAPAPRAIDKAEDRQLFKETMDERRASPPSPRTSPATWTRPSQAAARIGYPVIIRPAFTLGGGGRRRGPQRGGDAHVIAQDRAWTPPPSPRSLVEKYVFGWKEIEFEAMRDRAGQRRSPSAPWRTWTQSASTPGTASWWPPPLTLANPEYQMLRSASLEIVQRPGHRGRLQLPVRPGPRQLRLRGHRGQPPGEPLLRPGQQGHRLPHRQGHRQAGPGLHPGRDPQRRHRQNPAPAFEPAVDYVVAKFPKWPFDKFPTASRELGTQMKATGEVMAIAPSFEMARHEGLSGGRRSAWTPSTPRPWTTPPLEERLAPDGRPAPLHHLRGPEGRVRRRAHPRRHPDRPLVPPQAPEAGGL